MQHLNEINVLRYNSTTISLNETVNDDEDSTIEDFIPSTDTSINSILDNEMFRTTVQEIIQKFPPKEAELIKIRYLESNLTLEECAKKMNVTKERIRMIEIHALRLLRHPKNASKLIDFYKNRE